MFPPPQARTMRVSREIKQAPPSRRVKLQSNRVQRGARRSRGRALREVRSASRCADRFRGRQRRNRCPHRQRKLRSVSVVPLGVFRPSNSGACVASGEMIYSRPNRQRRAKQIRVGCTNSGSRTTKSSHGISRMEVGDSSRIHPSSDGVAQITDEPEHSAAVVWHQRKAKISR